MNGTLLVQVFRDEQAETLLKAEFLKLYPFQTKHDISLNFFLGAVNADLLNGMTNEEIQAALVNFSVPEAYRHIQKRGGTPFPLPTVVLTFEVPTLPITIEVGHEMATVHLLILNPLRCFQCQRFGHTQQRCGSSMVCGSCESGFGGASYPHPPHCENCNQAISMTVPDLCMWVRGPSENFE
jgi:hypothetical protein